jgi:hypothetical protein
MTSGGLYIKRKARRIGMVGVVAVWATAVVAMVVVFGRTPSSSIELVFALRRIDVHGDSVSYSYSLRNNSRVDLRISRFSLSSLIKSCDYSTMGHAARDAIEGTAIGWGSSSPAPGEGDYVLVIHAGEVASNDDEVLTMVVPAKLSQWFAMHAGSQVLGSVTGYIDCADASGYGMSFTLPVRWKGSIELRARSDSRR